MNAAAWWSFAGGLLGAFLGAVANVWVGEGKRRRDEDTALLGWCSLVYDWVVEGKITPAAARRMLEERRVERHWYKFNKRYAERVDAILDELDRAFAPPQPAREGTRERFVLDPEGGDRRGGGHDAQ
jgi:hypothetical protein